MEFQSDHQLRYFASMARNGGDDNNMSDNEDESPPNDFDEEEEDIEQPMFQDEEEVEESTPITYHRQIINGLEVSFPYKPYAIQTEYMSRVITCLDKVIVFLFTIAF